MCDLRGARLVVRATRDISIDEEVLIDYGDSARPQWRCLASYGFVPSVDGGGGGIDAGVYPDVATTDGDGDDGHANVVEDGDVAELWVNGRRFEVDSMSVPFELVEVAAARGLLDDDDSPIDEIKGGAVGGEVGALSPSVARFIARRATDTAYNLILEPDVASSEEDWDDPEFVRAMGLAAALRRSQRRVLLAFAENLKEFYTA
jgi:hypothetical protein